MNMIFTIPLLLMISSSSFIPSINSHQFSSTHPSKHDLGLKLSPKTSNLHFYFYDKVTDPNATAVRIASAATTNASQTLFGGLVMIDDPLLEGPQKNSKVIGRAQGMYGGADMNTLALLMVVNYVFTDGSEFNGSTLSVLGRNEIPKKTREMPILGGTGIFRMARGFALASEKWSNKEGDAIVEYNLTVYHFG